MNTLIITDKPWKFKSNNTTIVNRENKYTDANGTIDQHRPMARLLGFRANKVIIYEPPMSDIVTKYRYIEWLYKCVMHSTVRHANFVYVRGNTVMLTTTSRWKFYEFIKEVLCSNMLGNTKNP